MKRLALLLFFAFFALPANATTYYISYSTGSNSNNGTSESTPWQTHPYMQSASGCGGSLPTYSHTAGDKFVFKQGDSWPNACFDMVIAAGGTSSTVEDVYTFDPTWGAAGGTTGNVGQNVGVYQFTAGGTVINGTDTLNEFIHDAAANFITFNGMELTGQTWTGTGAAAAIDITTSTNITVTNIWAHEWTHSGATADTYAVIEGTGSTPFNVAAGLSSSVVDGTDSGGTGIADSGVAVLNLPSANNDIVRNMPRGILLNASALAHDNNVSLSFLSFDSSIEPTCLSPVTMVAGGFSLVYLYNNVVHDCTGIGILTQGAASNSGREFDYLWNNVAFIGQVARSLTVTWTLSVTVGTTSQTVYRAQSAAGPFSVLASVGPSTTSYSDAAPLTLADCYYVTAINASGESAPSATTCFAPPSPLQFDSNSTENNGSQVHAWNNTLVGGTSDSCMATINRANGNFETLDIQNNHCVSNQGVITLAITGNTYTNNNNVLMSTSTAATQGYTSSETYAYSPTAVTNGTVGAGTNLTSIVESDGPGFPFATLADDTTYGGVRLPNIRPTTWDVGAYQWKTLLFGNFYVDNCVTVGNDSNSGTSPSTPWLTIGQVNLSGFNPGSTISLQSTCLWRETLTPPSSGASGNPITFTSYGTGALPILDGADLQSGWISGEPAVSTYQASTAADNSYDDGHFLEENTTTLNVSNSSSSTYTTGTRFENVTLPQAQSVYSATWQGYVYPGDTINTTMYGEAADNSAAFPTAGGTVICTGGTNPQCPNGRAKTSSNTPWATINSGGYQSVTVTSIVQQILNRAGWTSGNAMTVLTSSPGPSVPLFGRVYTNSFGTGALLTITTITPAANIYAVPFTWTDKFDAAGPVYFDGVQVSQGVASLGALTANNEWYYDYASLAPFLYIYSTTNPNSRVIEIASRPRLAAFFCSGRSYVNAGGISFQKSRNYNVEISGCDHVTMTGNESTKSGSLGMNIEGDSTNIVFSGGSSHDNGGLYPGDNDCVGIGGKGSVGNTPVTVTGMDLYNCVNTGIEVYAPSSAFTTTTTLQFNYIHGNGICNMAVPAVICAGNGVQTDGPGNQATLVQGNIIAGNLGNGILGQARGTFAMNAFSNAIADNGQNGEYAQLGAWTSKNNLLLNNATTMGYFEVFAPNTVGSWTSDYNDFYHAAGGNFMSWSGTATTFSGFQSASSGDADSQSADPKVTNEGTQNYTLLSNSPLIDAGANLGSQYQNALLPTSTWPNGVATGNQNFYGSGWEIGAFIYPVTYHSNGALWIARDFHENYPGVLYPVKANPAFDHHGN